MAGRRRRSSQAPATFGGDVAPATPSQDASTPSTQGNASRVTRSSRGIKDAGAGRDWLARPADRPSRIVTLKTGRPRNSAANDAHASHSQSAAQSTSDPQTPRVGRPRRNAAVKNTPMTTRHSARIKGQSNLHSNDDSAFDDGDEDKLESGSPGTAYDNETKHASQEAQNGDKESSRAQNSSNSTSQMADDTASENAEKSNLLQSRGSQRPSTESNSSDQASNSSSDENSDIDPSTFLSHLSNSRAHEPLLNPESTPSPSVFRKRKSYELEDYDAESSNVSASPTKKVKIDDDQLDRASEEQPQDGVNKRRALGSPTDGDGESKVKDESDQATKEADSSPETGMEFSSIAGARGHTRGGRGSRGSRGRRGRRRGRGSRGSRGGLTRSAARVKSIRRGTGRGRARGFRGGRVRRHSNVSDRGEFHRSPSPSAEAQNLRDRQRELDKAFRKVAAAQRLALAELAAQSEKRVTREKDAHINVPEYDQINLQLREKLRMKQEALRHEYALRVDQETRLLAAEEERINESFRISAQYIKEEHLRAAQGAYMSFVEGQRAAEDEEHTETDESDGEPNGIISKPAKPHVRGFNSSSVRAPAGAAVYQLAKAGWDDFVQRAKVGEDINPQMREMGQGANQDRPLSGIPPQEALSLLIRATGLVEQEAEPRWGNPNALPILAEAAAARAPVMQRTLYPQLVPGPPSLVLPRPQPRRLLPAGQQMLPDPFGGLGPVHLPPPPGSNFQRPPLPGFLPGQPLYYPPPPPGPRPPY